ncbi:acyl-CoA reductase [Cytobacillus spongiae]|uniref:acyl-CoA reductase n=1 Tax=Cytobacillus spongiae TaxID=2901381 RepID=UPI001F1CC1B1|nr:acyl-CoA reductase [Cytobacillus spongiae]UII56420.1 acyl-CoA reductase [Cytobacillus spongiae]
MTEFIAGFIPDTFQETIDLHTLTFTKHEQLVTVKVPKLCCNQYLGLIQHLKENRERVMKSCHTNELIEVIDQAVTRWLDPNEPNRKLAEQLLPIITGYDDEMIRTFLTDYLRSFRKEKLQRMIEEDFPNPLVLDEFRPRHSGGLTRAYGPDLMAHIFSGNVPALPLWSLAAGLLLKSATLGKVSSSEPVFSSLFVRTIAEIRPEIARCMAIVWWKGGDEEIEKIVFSHSSRVIAYGSHQTIEAVKQRVPTHVPLHTHGHKVSASVVGSECLQGPLVKEVIKRVARDVATFDQQACLSPHVIFVEKGGKITPREFAGMLAQEMNNLEVKMKRAVLTEEEVSAIHAARAKVHFSSFRSEGTDLYTSVDSSVWTVVYEESDHFPYSVLNRFITVIPLDSLKELSERLAPVSRVIQSVGVACTPKEFQTLIHILGEAGVNRICSIGEMIKPEPGWHHDGRFHLAELVSWCDVESTVESMIDEFDPFRI